MAKIGMRKPRVYPFASSMNGVIPDSGEVTYESSSVSLGKAVSGTLNENRTSSDLYADDSVAEHVEDFTSGTFEVTVDDLDPETRGKVLGANISAVDASKGEVGYGADDTPPYMGYGYIEVKRKGGTTSYVGHFFPAVKGSPASQSWNTKGENIIFNTETITFTVMPLNTEGRRWHFVQKFTSESAADAWINSKAGITVGG